MFEPVLLDALQHIVGYRGWLDGWFLMPVGMKRITRFGPIPQAGSRIRASVHYRKLDGRRVEADYEAYDEAGRLWIRVDGLQALARAQSQGPCWRPTTGRAKVTWRRPWPLHSPAVHCYRVKIGRFGRSAARLARPSVSAPRGMGDVSTPPYGWTGCWGAWRPKMLCGVGCGSIRAILLHPLEVEISTKQMARPV